MLPWQEVISTRPSRSGYEDDEPELDMEVPDHRQPCKLEWKWTFPGVESYENTQKDIHFLADVLLIAASPAGCAFLNVNYTPYQESARCVSKSGETVVGALYSLKTTNESAYLWVFEHGLPSSVDAWTWTERLFECVTAKNIFVYDSLYFGTPGTLSFGSNIQPPMLRYLKTSSFTHSHGKSTEKLSELEVPNIVEGFGAAVFLYCEYNKFNALMFLSLQEQLKGRNIVSVECLEAYDQSKEFICLPEEEDDKVSLKQKYLAKVKSMKQKSCVTDNLLFI